MQITAQMLREAFRQTQREILATSLDYHARWERIAELLNEQLLGNKQETLPEHEELPVIPIAYGIDDNGVPIE